MLYFLISDVASRDAGNSSSDPALSSDCKEINKADSSGPDVDTLYQQALRFLEVNEQLNTAPDTLRQQCDKLVSAKKQLSRAIEDLKRQSESVVP